MGASLASTLKGAILPIVGPETFERIRLAPKFGYVPNIASPRSYNEKLLHRKFYCPVAHSEIYADKWRVRDFVRSKLGPQVLNEVYCVARRPEAIEFDCLPAQFALKMNNGSKRNILVRDKSKLDLAAIRAQLEQWVETPFGTLTSETFYLRIEPLIMVERYVPHDVFYSLHVFHGRTRYIETHADPFGPRHWSNWYDPLWRMQPFIQGTQGGEPLPRPRFLAEMIAAADRLAEGFDYVRIDFFPADDEHFLFTEMTLVPAAGYSPFTPKEVDFELGALW
jgi:teichuronopeptide biosynthesis TupA-like protein